MTDRFASAPLIDTMSDPVGDEQPTVFDRAHPPAEVCGSGVLPGDRAPRGMDLSEDRTERWLRRHPPPLPEQARAQHWLLSILKGQVVPALGISWLSIIVSGACFAILTRSASLRSLFFLDTWTAPLAGSTAVLAWIIVLRTRKRPSFKLPIVWACTLAFAATGCLATTYTQDATSRPSWVDAATVGLAAGAMLLALRLMRIPPARALLGRIVPLAAAGGAGLLVASWWLGAAVTSTRTSQVRADIRRLEHAAEVVRDVEAAPWRSMLLDAPDLADDSLKRLESPGIDGIVSDPRLWQMAAATGLADDLDEAATDLLDALTQALTSPRRPTLSFSAAPPVRWDSELKEWVQDEAFPALTERVGRYRRLLGQLVTELMPPSADDQPPDEHQDDYAAHHAKVQRQLAQTLSEQMLDWTDGWSVQRVPGYERLVGRREVSFPDLLEQPLADPEASRSAASIRPWDLWRLMHLEQWQAKDLGQAAPACTFRSYVAKGRSYRRLDCDAYQPTSGSEGAEPRLELRLVYVQPSDEEHTDRTKPVEFFFLIPVPLSEEHAEELGAEVLKDLYAAITEHWDGRLLTFGSGGTPATGFWLRKDGRTLVVYRPTVVSFRNDQKAVQIRGEW